MTRDAAYGIIHRYLTKQFELPAEKISPQADLFTDLELDSIDALDMIALMEKDLGIKAGETTPDYRMTFEIVYCLGSCGLAPTAMVDNEVVGQLVSERMVQIARELK
jgi:acyl carrier protein